MSFDNLCINGLFIIIWTVYRFNSYCLLASITFAPFTFGLR